MLADFNLGDLLWSMLVFFFWFMAIWIFIALFSDIFRRNDLSGWGKAGWIILIFVVPFLGALIYIGVRPKMTEQDRQMLADYQQQQRAMSGSPADEITKLSKLHDDGKLTDEEFASLKKKAMA